ncbi:wax ester/triacylglycerol synthase domain-containing protein [Streptomyces sp. NPDC056982]|uniref:wax ester/triacylglycerol synthase domain-containing protein n=1 Tax=Streptomyces sp. NPDC056982 TaxID=3345986 RepID=UPI00363CABB3
MTRPAPPSHLATSSTAPEHTTSRPSTAMPPLDAWMHRQQSSGGSNMTAALLAWFEGPPPALSALRSMAKHRLAPYERLRQMPSAAEPAEDSWPLWSTGPHFEAAHHIVESPGAATTELEEDIAALFSAPLDPRRPPWQLHLIPTTGGFVLLFRAHHALLDGRSIATLLRALFDETAGLRPPRAGGPATAETPARARQLAWILGDLLPKGRPLPFHGPVDPYRVLSFRQVPREELDAARASLRSAASAERASTNAVFLAATAGALRSLGVTGRPLPALPGICALVPVDVRTSEESQLLGNHYATVRVPLPQLGDARDRLAAVDSFIRRAAIGARARAQAAVVSSRPRKITPLSNAAGRYVDSPRYFSLLCSSVSTHAGELTIGSARLTAMAAIPPLGPGHPLAVTAIHHGSTSVVTAVTDHSHRDLAQPLAERIHDEIRILAG